MSPSNQKEYVHMLSRAKTRHPVHVTCLLSGGGLRRELIRRISFSFPSKWYLLTANRMRPEREIKPRKRLFQSITRHLFRFTRRRNIQSIKSAFIHSSFRVVNVAGSGRGEIWICGGVRWLAATEKNAQTNKWLSFSTSRHFTSSCVYNVPEDRMDWASGQVAEKKNCSLSLRCVVHAFPLTHTDTHTHISDEKVMFERMSARTSSAWHFM